MRGDMKGVRTLFTLKIKFLGYMKNAWRQEWEETASRDYHKLACSMGGRKGRMSLFSLRSSPRFSSLHLTESLHAQTRLWKAEFSGPASASFSFLPPLMSC